MSNFKYKEEYAWLSNICLNVTDACNLKCKYCFVEQHPHFMSLDTAKSAVDFIVRNAEKKEQKFNKKYTPSLTFFGGEPTLLWDEIIVPLTNYIKENDFNISLSITTNGTLLNKERINFLKENDIHILLSIDGNKETQDFNRPCHNEAQSSFDLVEKNISYILEAFPNTVFRSTIYAPTAHKTFENYMYAIEKGFKNIYMTPNDREEWTEEEKEILCQEVDKIFMYNEMCYSKNISVPTFSTIDQIQKLLPKFVKSNTIEDNLSIQRNYKRCGLGITLGSIGWDGNIYGCQEQTSKDDKNIFYIGNIKTGIDIEKHKILLEEFNKKGISSCSKSERCKDCSLRKICYGFNCPSVSYDLFNNFLLSSEMTCLWYEKLFANSMILYSRLLNNENYIKYFESVVK